MNEEIRAEVERQLRAARRRGRWLFGLLVLVAFSGRLVWAQQHAGGLGGQHQMADLFKVFFTWDSTTLTVANARTVVSTVASGSDALRMSNGARVNLGSGLNDYLVSDGTVSGTPGPFSAVPIAAQPAAAFASPSAFLSFVIGSQTDSNYGAPGNGGLYAGARVGSTGLPPTLAPFTALSVFDLGSAGFSSTDPDTGRIVYHGGGGWGAPDCNNHQFYTAAAYTETVDTGILRFHISPEGSLRFLGPTSQETPISPTAISGSNNNYNPTGLSGASVVRQDASAAATLTGLTAQIAGREIYLHNISTTFSITLTHQDTASTAANRFILPGALPLVLRPGGATRFWYDTTSSRWRTTEEDTPPSSLASVYVNNTLFAFIYGGGTLPARPFTVTDIAYYIRAGGSGGTDGGAADNNQFRVSDGTNFCGCAFNCATDGGPQIATCTGDAGTGCVFAASAALTYSFPAVGTCTTPTDILGNIEVRGRWQ